MGIFSKFAIFLCAVSVSFSAVAGVCDKFTGSYDKTYCLSKLFIESDNELNAVYKELKGLIDEDTSKSLTKVQREWIKYRNAQCENNGTINVDCNYDVNKARTDYLRKMVEECKIGYCQKDKIGQKSW